MYYFDHAASTPVLPCAVTAFLRAPRGNPDSTHAMGRQAKESLEESRAIIAECINAKPEEIYFCSGGTEANNLVIQTMLKHGPALYSASSHASVWNIPLYRIDRPESGISVPYINNETGEILSMKRIAEDKAAYPLLHLDGVAAVGQYDVNVDRLSCDYLTASGHKFGAPQGIGFIYAKKNVPICPMFYGGKQEKGIRPGTPSVALAAAMAAALQYRTEHIYEAWQQMRNINEFIRGRVQCMSGGHIPAADLQWKTAAHILSVRFDGVPSAQLLPLLDAQGVCCSAGSACSAGSRTPSRVLLASGLSEKEALETVRISICPETTQHDAEILLSALKNAVEKLRKILPRAR